MKRKEQILVVSLQLFNTEGEANLSAVDIANEMDISPGNLYYHYRGKEEIVAALFDRFEGALRTLLQEALRSDGSREDFIVLYYALLEQIYEYRFFYRNLNDLVDKYPEIAARFRRLIALKQSFCEASVVMMVETGFLDSKRVASVGLVTIAENLVMMLTYFYEYTSLSGSPLDKRGYIKMCLKKIASLVGPYAGDDMTASIDYARQVIKQLDDLGKN